MIATNISYYQTVKQTKGAGTISIDLFLDNVQNCHWQDDIVEYLAGRKHKSDLPAVTMSGEFSERRIKGLIKHSGYICIDIDDVDPDDVRAELCTDRFVAAAWKSVSGKGLAVLFRIDPRKHREAFDGLGEYLFNTYGLVIDPACKDVSRARFISMDPDLYVNAAAAKFALYPKPKPKALKKLPKTIFVRSDFNDVINQLEARSLDVVDDYQYWLAIAFAFADKFGEGGREFFHRISRIGTKYDEHKCDRQYTACLRNTKGSGATIGTFYWLCKQAGIQTMSKQSKLVATTASQAKKGGRTPADTLKLLKDVENIPEATAADIVKQVFENDIDFKSDESFIYELETWLRQNFEIRRNSITRKIEDENGPMEQREFNSVYMEGRRVFDKELSYDIFERLINSSFTPDFNPLLEWLDNNKERHTTGNIEKLCSTIITGMDAGYVRFFVEKWLVGIMESIHGEMSSLMLVLAGDRQNTGKTEWFRRLLPKDIRQYYAESKLDSGKDDEILMTQKLIIMDDEMAGKSKRDAHKMKELTSKKWFSLREPYGRQNVDLKRMAVLAGTSNDLGLLNDPTGNRRIIPIHVLDIDKELYNSIDKTELFIEVYHKWQDGGLSSDLTREQIEYLNAQTTDFEAVSIERELIQVCFEPAPKGQGTFMTTTDIKVRLEQYSGQRIQLNKMGQELKNLGFERTNGYVGGKKSRSKGFCVFEVNRQGISLGDSSVPF